MTDKTIIAIETNEKLFVEIEPDLEALEEMKYIVSDNQEPIDGFEEFRKYMKMKDTIHTLYVDDYPLFTDENGILNYGAKLYCFSPLGFCMNLVTNSGNDYCKYNFDSLQDLYRLVRLTYITLFPNLLYVYTSINQMYYRIERKDNK